MLKNTRIKRLFIYKMQYKGWHSMHSDIQLVINNPIQDFRLQAIPTNFTEYSLALNTSFAEK